MQINSSSYSVVELLNMLERRELMVNADYQRSSNLWPPTAASYFIDTILEEYPFPKIYMHEYLDRTNRKVRKDLVDGQQRINTVQRFFRDEFAISGESSYAGLKYSDLDQELQDRFLSYTVSVDVIRNATKAQILQMFRRMNAFTLPLNEAEKRHSAFYGPFKWLINNLADYANPFFIEFGVFNNRQILRMVDAELLSDCVLAIEKGIVSTSPTDLTKLYNRYDESFPKSEEYREQIASAVNFIADNFSSLRNTHMMKPYALYSLITLLVHAKFEIPKITALGIRPANAFSVYPVRAAEIELLSLARAHEAKELTGPYREYVWGCVGATNRAPRRVARACHIALALGLEVCNDAMPHIS